jgi:EAL domain-containing protein (putative c-di-GMP-specific phosphodiesterase class I)
MQRDWIERAIRERDFTVVYQPIVDLGSGAVLGVEALTRFHDGRAPDSWFLECQDAGLAAAMDLAIIERALEDVDRLPEGYLALNLALDTLSSVPALLRLLTPALDRRRIMLELSERVRVQDYTVLRRQLAPLREAGVLIAVDDVGAGYASVQHIVSLLPDVFKLDRSFVASIDTNMGRRAFALAAGVLGRGINAVVVAEGVETPAEALTLRRAGIGPAQGFYLGRPQALPIAPCAYSPPTVDLAAHGDTDPVPTGIRDAATTVRHATEVLRSDAPFEVGERRRRRLQRIDDELTCLERAAAELRGRLAESGPSTPTR